MRQRLSQTYKLKEFIPYSSTVQAIFNAILQAENDVKWKSRSTESNEKCQK